MQLLALLSSQPAPARRSRAGTRWRSRPAAAPPCLGLDADIGTLEAGKWADLCCVDLSAARRTQPLRDPVTQLVFCGGRDIVSDVWVAGRQLLVGGRIDPPGLARRGRARRCLGRATATPEGELMQYIDSKRRPRGTREIHRARAELVGSEGSVQTPARSQSAAPAVCRARGDAARQARCSMSAAAAAFCPRRWRAPAPGCSASICRRRCSTWRNCMRSRPRSPSTIGRSRPRNLAQRTARRIRFGDLHGNARARARSGRQRGGAWPRW